MAMTSLSFVMDTTKFLHEIKRIASGELPLEQVSNAYLIDLIELHGIGPELANKILSGIVVSFSSEFPE